MKRVILLMVVVAAWSLCSLCYAGDGDVNGDGAVTIQDALSVLRVAVNLVPSDTTIVSHGDVAPIISGEQHPDGNIDIADALAILKKSVNLPAWFTSPVCGIAASTCTAGTPSGSTDTGGMTVWQCSLGGFATFCNSLQAERLVLDFDPSTSSIRIAPTVIDGHVKGLIREGTPADVLATDVTHIVVSGVCGYHVVDPSKGSVTVFDPANPVTYFANVLGADEISISVLLRSGEELFFNTTFAVVLNTPAVVLADGRIRYGDLSGTPLLCPPLPKTVIDIFPGDRIEITPSVTRDGKLSGLIFNGQTVDVLPENSMQIVWNGIDNWYPVAGTRVDMVLPMTTLPAKVTDTGMPYLVNPDGSPFPFNLDLVTVRVNGADVTSTAVIDGLIHW